MGSCCRGCCTGFWGSIPYATLLAVTVTVLGLIGHVASMLHGTITISRVYPFENVDDLFIPFIGALSGATMLLIVTSFILALLSTGYSRNIIYFYHFQKCIGAMFTILTITLTFVFTLIWLLYGFLLAAVVMVAVGLQVSCDELEAIAGPQGLDDPNLCLPLATGLNGTGIVGEDVCGDNGLQDLCDDGKLAGDGFATSLGFVVVVVTGQVLATVTRVRNCQQKSLLILMIQAGNCVYTRLADQKSQHAEEVMDIELKYTSQVNDLTDV